jgi:hypothetical protein
MNRPSSVRVALVALAAVLVVAGTAAATCGSSRLAGAREATAGFHKLDRAKAAGYTTKVVDLNKLSCIAEPGEGAMGVHYLNPGLLDDSVSETSPELVIYEPGKNGKLRFVGLEYLTIKSVWDASHSSPPSLFGHEFMLTGADNRFGLPPYYSLHAWIWKHNPSGMFQMWNPKVHCP